MLQVVRTALVDAASVSSLMMTSEAIVVEAPEDKKPAAAWRHGGHARRLRGHVLRGPIDWAHEAPHQIPMCIP